MKYFYFVLTAIFLLGLRVNSFAQLSASADGQATTNYSTGPQDKIFIFCSQQGASAGSLTAQFSTGAAADFDWLKYNAGTGNFDAYQAGGLSVSSSQISGLADGAYRVNVVSAGVTETYTAWVFNSWYAVSASITESTCDYFQLSGSFTEASLAYTDLSNGNTLSVAKNVRAKWEVNSETVSTVISPTIYDPPSENTSYELTIYDGLGCSASATVYYESIVPKAAFSVSLDPTSGEAPCEVTFSNQSVNADSYEWFFFCEKTEIEEEAAAKGIVSDSIMDVATDTNPVYTYEYTGDYMVKLVATKVSSSATCRDTSYLDDYIVILESAFDVPNVFTPNNDGDNDDFVVKYTSMKSLNMKIFNRWGKLVFSVSKNNLGDYESSGKDASWDGKISGKDASPGVYYYVIEGVGRDDKRYKKAGFVHLYR